MQDITISALSSGQIKVLNDLKKSGIYGNSIEDVARYLLIVGMERALPVIEKLSTQICASSSKD